MSAKHRLSLIPLAVLTLTLALAVLASAQVHEAWVTRYNGPTNGHDYAYSLTVDGSGNVYVTGKSSNGSNDDYLTVKYDSAGNLIWEKRYNGPANSRDDARALSVDGSGNVYVTGYSDNGNNYDYSTLKYGSGGNLIWEKRYNGPANRDDFVTALSVDGSGNVYVTGYSSNSSNEDYATLKYNSVGNLLWERRYNGPANNNDYALALSVDGSGNVYVTGKSSNGSNDDYLTVKYDSAGNLIWQQRYNGPANSLDSAQALFVDGSGNVYVTGRSHNGSNDDYLTVKYDSAGNLIWQQRYNGPANSTDQAWKLSVDGSGNVYVTGRSHNGSNYDSATLKYGSGGNLIWERRYNGPANGGDEANALAVDGSGNVYVAGISNNGSNNDYLTLKYDSAGNLAWEKRYNGPGNGTDNATALGVGGSGNVYVTGNSYGSNDDYATIKYTQQPQASFTEVGSSANVADAGQGHGVAWGDYDDDGDLDLYLSNQNNGTNRLYRNEGNGSFAEVGSATGVADSGDGFGVAWGDYDNDGDLDLYLVNYGSANRLYRNNGNGTFTETAAAAGVNSNANGRTGVWGDYDNDGDLDLYLVNYGSANRLYRNGGNGTFTDVGSSAGVNASANGLTAAWGDYDGDGDLDLYVSNQNSADLLYRNNGDGTFTNMAASAQVTDIGNGVAVAWGDYDNDGDLDLFVANASGQTDRLYRNNGNGAFTETAVGAGISDTYNGIGVAWGDYDNDGDLDLYVSNHDFQPNFLYQNNGDGTFAEVGASLGVNDTGRGRGVAWGDYNNDGFLDLYLANDASANRLYRNSGNDNRWLQVRLVGTVSNRAGIGARVTTVTGARNQRRDVDGGSGSGQQPSLPVEFGFGNVNTVDQLTVRWPSGIVQTVNNVATNQVLTVTEPALTGFTEVGATAGVNNNGSDYGAAWGDYDNDGDLDLYVANNVGVSKLYRNNGNGTFTDVATTAGVAGTGVRGSWGDYDNDGDPDLYVANYGANRLCRNNGDGTFTDVGSSAGVDDAGNGNGAAWGDYDNDGDLDLYLSNNTGTNRLYRNNGNGIFTDVGSGAGVDDAWAGRGVAWGDYDNDGDLDLYLVKENQPNKLYRNNGNGTFTDVASTAGVNNSGSGIGAAWADYDNDGDLDLYVTNTGAQPNLLYRNNGNGTFASVASGAGVADTGNGEDIAWGDYDNDGDLDLHVSRVAAANRLYRNNGDGTFTDVASMIGVNDSGNGEGVAWGDYDGDGDLDLYLANNSSANRLYRNSGNSNRWLQVRFVGTVSNRDGIGARVTAVTGAASQRRDVDGGSGRSSQPSLPAEFGFGSATTVDQLTVRWPSGKVQTLTNVATNQVITVTEPGSPDLRVFGRVVFTATRDGNPEIYSMNADGTGLARLTSNSVSDDVPSWSPDGTKVAFQSNQNGANEIYVMNADGTGQTRLTNNSWEDSHPSWSPDGTRIVFRSERDGNPEIYTMNADGSGLTRLTNNPAQDHTPSWSPDGTKIVFWSTRDGNFEIYVMNADGTGQTRLTSNTAYDYNPSWSSDGAKIAFHSDRDGNFEIYTMNANGSGVTRLTNNLSEDYNPFWSPDGTRLVFYSRRDGNAEIYVMNADGTGQTRLTNNATSDMHPSWAQFRRIGAASVGGSVSREMTIENRGVGTLTVSSITSSDPQFALNPMNLTVAAGAAGTVTVSFNPTSGGTKYATLTIASDDMDAPTARLTVNGTAGTTAPVYNQSASSLSFGSVNVGASGAQTFTVSNTGNAALSVGTITVTGADAGQFSVSPTSFTVNAGGPAQTVTVTFTPGSSGTKSASLSIPHNATGSPATVTLSGTGAAPVYSQSVSSLSFGNVVVGMSGAKTFTVSNTGDAAMTVSGITVGGTDAAMFSASPATFTINAGGPAQTVTVRFTPTSSGSKTASLSIAHNAAGSPATVTLSGTGTIARQIALGLGRYPSAGGYFEVRNNALGSYSHRSWPRVQWSYYNSVNGETRAAVGDIDGDGWDEIVVGLGPRRSGWSNNGGVGYLEVFDDVRTGYAHMAWLQVPWSWYNNNNGETRPAVGDVDGDGKAEIVVGLGKNGGGYFCIFDDASRGFAFKGLRRINWPSYNSNNGETRPAVGDVDGDGRAEIVLGFGPFPSDGGRMAVVSMNAALTASDVRRWVRVPWSAYNSANGETWPAVGDIDGDGRAEIVAGLGTYRSNGGWMYIFEDEAAGFASKGWLRVLWSAYNSANGETRPAVGDTDGNGKAEVVVGLGTSGGGWFLTFHGVDGSSTTVYWNQIPWSAYNSAVGSSQPAVGRLAP